MTCFPAAYSLRRRIKKLPQALDKTLSHTLDTIKTSLVGESSLAGQSHSGKDELLKTSEDSVAHTLETKTSSEVYPMRYVDSMHFSKVLQKSVQSEKDHEGNDEEHPSLDPATPALVDDTDEESEDDVHAFDHPSTYVDQPWIWIPTDHLGLSSLLVKELMDVGVCASDAGAEMREDGTVEVSRNPPDEKWSGGYNA